MLGDMEVLKVDEWLNSGFERINEICVLRKKDNRIYFLKEVVYNDTKKHKDATITLKQFILYFCSNNQHVLLHQEHTTMYTNGDGGGSTKIIKKHINEI
jgi:hypothetical protein